MKPIEKILTVIWWYSSRKTWPEIIWKWFDVKKFPCSFYFWWHIPTTVQNSLIATYLSTPLWRCLGFWIL